jgi:hypothetical protein
LRVSFGFALLFDVHIDNSTHDLGKELAEFTAPLVIGPRLSRQFWAEALELFEEFRDTKTRERRREINERFDEMLALLESLLPAVTQAASRRGTRGTGWRQANETDDFSTAAVATMSAAGPVNALQGFSTCHAAGTTAISISGFDTRNAKMVSVMTLPDAMEACDREQQLKGAALTTCAEKTLKEENLGEVIVWANCAKGTLAVRTHLYRNPFTTRSLEALMWNATSSPCFHRAVATIRRQLPRFISCARHIKER